MAVDTPTPPTATPAPPRPSLLETIRRFSDRQFTTVLHSLIGLPSSLTPPQTSGWITSEDLAPGEAHPLPRPRRSPSDSLGVVGEVQKKMQEDSENNNNSGSGTGVVALPSSSSSSSSSAGAAVGGASAGSSANREGINPLAPLTGILNTFRAFDETHRGFLRPAPPALQKEPQQQTAQAVEEGCTELDYYTFFESQYRADGGPASYPDMSRLEGARKTQRSAGVAVQIDNGGWEEK